MQESRSFEQPRRPVLIATGLALAFLALHLPYLPHSLEDVDSINFALGLQHFDVARHQPHPPGYPLYIGVGKIVRAFVSSEARALGAISAATGALGVIALAAFFLALERRRAAGTALSAMGATALALTAPLYWFTSVRPLSDVPGLALSLGIMAVSLGGPSTAGRIGAAAFLVALGAGVRSQVVWLTAPLFLFTLVRGPNGFRRPEMRLVGVAIAGLAAGTLAWAIPLLVLTGGPRAYWDAVFFQASEDLSGVAMLWTTPTLRQLIIVLTSAFVAPWANPIVAGVMVVLAVIGAVRLARRDRLALATLAVTFGPYVAFDVLFQESITTRYALPLVVPEAYLAAQGAGVFGSAAGMVVMIALSVFNAHVGGTSAAAYARQDAPAFRMLADMAQTSPAGGDSVTLGMDRRLDFDLRRPIRWVGDRVPGVTTRLPSPPKREWIELVKHWNDPRTPPNDTVWFLADPPRDYMGLIQHAPPKTYRWSLPYPILLGGVRPGDLDWYTLRQPEWYVAEGWSLTPESNGLTQVDRLGLDHAAVEGWISRDVFNGGAILVGGRNLTAPPVDVRLTLTAGNTTLGTIAISPGPFLNVLPAANIDAAVFSPSGYAKIVVRADPPTTVTLEQFDASAKRPLLGFGTGWYEYEYNPTTEMRWRWLSERGTLILRAPRGAVLHLDGESPRTYFSRASHLMVRIGRHTLVDEQLASDFSLAIPISPALIAEEGSTITLETDQVFVPSEHGLRRTHDQRHLGLRFLRWELSDFVQP